MTHEESVVDWLREQISQTAPAAERRTLERCLRALAVWRSRAIATALIRAYGATVLGGPFAGMAYQVAATEGALAPRLIGTYESELHPYLERFAAQDFEVVIDIGCAEGYYAVGLARLMPQAVVHAYDVEPKALEACLRMAAANGVEARVVTHPEFAPGDFEAFAGRRCLVMMDVEGSETDLLRPDLAPALGGMTLIVETHDLYRQDALSSIEERFEATHDITCVRTGPKTMALPPEMAQQSHLDQLLAVWEWRLRPTPWLVMTPKSGAGAQA